MARNLSLEVQRGMAMVNAIFIQMDRKGQFHTPHDPVAHQQEYHPDIEIILPNKPLANSKQVSSTPSAPIKRKRQQLARRSRTPYTKP